MALQNISEKTGISVGLLVTVGGLLVTGAGTAFVAVYRVGALEQTEREHRLDEKEYHAKMESALERRDESAAAQDKRLTVVETNLSNITSALGRIEGKLDTRVVNAKGHQP